MKYKVCIFATSENFILVSFSIYEEWIDWPCTLHRDGDLYEPSLDKVNVYSLLQGDIPNDMHEGGQTTALNNLIIWVIMTLILLWGDFLHVYIYIMVSVELCLNQLWSLHRMIGCKSCENAFSCYLKDKLEIKCGMCILHTDVELSHSLLKLYTMSPIDEGCYPVKIWNFRVPIIC